MQRTSRITDYGRTTVALWAGALLLVAFFQTAPGLATLGAGSVHLPDSVALAIVGSGAGGCGIAVGVFIGVAALAAGTVTVGFGTAVVLSTALHVGVLNCFFG